MTLDVLMEAPWFLNDGSLNVFQPPFLQAFLVVGGATGISVATNLAATVPFPVQPVRRAFFTFMRISLIGAAAPRPENDGARVLGSPYHQLGRLRDMRERIVRAAWSPCRC